MAASSTNVLAKVKVCIIGAGVSGLSAAATLIESGINDVMVLESLNRVGGRVHTVEHEGKILELGAQWIHGEDGNSVFEWAKNNCPESIETTFNLVQTGSGNTLFVDQHGNVMDQNIVESFQFIAANIEESDMTACNISFGEVAEKQFAPLNKWGSNGWQMLDWHGRLQAVIDGSPSWHVVSAASRNQFRECPGNSLVNWGERGYQIFIDDLVKRVGMQRIKLNSPVSNIQYSEGANEIADAMESGLNLASKSSNVPKSPCIINLTDQSSDGSIQADHIIFTGSLGFLKENALQLFQPILPSIKLKAIEGLGFSTVAKVYISFRERWWPEDIDGFSFLNDLSATPPDPYEEWPDHLLGFYKVNRHPNMLSAWVTGPSAVAMESSDLQSVMNKCYLVLNKRLQHLYNVTEPVWATRSQWGMNPYMRGSYSFRSMLSDQMNVWAKDLAEPVLRNDVPVLCFGGEATHDHFYSTVHGAYDSGVRESNRLIKFFNKSDGDVNHRTSDKNTQNMYANL